MEERHGRRHFSQQIIPNSKGDIFTQCFPWGSNNFDLSQIWWIFSFFSEKTTTRQPEFPCRQLPLSEAQATGPCGRSSSSTLNIHHCRVACSSLTVSEKFPKYPLFSCPSNMNSTDSSFHSEKWYYGNDYMYFFPSKCLNDSQDATRRHSSPHPHSGRSRIAPSCLGPSLSGVVLYGFSPCPVFVYQGLLFHRITLPYPHFTEFWEALYC